jgi:hypothetical protein
MKNLKDILKEGLFDKNITDKYSDRFDKIKEYYPLIDLLSDIVNDNWKEYGHNCYMGPIVDAKIMKQIVDYIDSLELSKQDPNLIMNNNTMYVHNIRGDVASIKFIWNDGSHKRNNKGLCFIERNDKTEWMSMFIIGDTLDFYTDYNIDSQQWKNKDIKVHWLTNDPDYKEFIFGDKLNKLKYE